MTWNLVIIWIIRLTGVSGVVDNLSNMSIFVFFYKRLISIDNRLNKKRIRLQMLWRTVIIVGPGLM